MLGIFTHTAWQLLAVSAQVNNCGGGDCSTGLPVVNATGSQLNNILQILFGVLAAIAVLMVVIGGLRFVLADNPQDAAKARDTIIYALVGLIIALAAEAIVSFVLGQLK